jgi:hypothetical protein
MSLRVLIPFDGTNAIPFDPVRRVFPFPCRDEFATLKEWSAAFVKRHEGMRALAGTSISTVGLETYYVPGKVQHTYQLRSRTAAALEALNA